jgi:hypothetical protein
VTTAVSREMAEQRQETQVQQLLGWLKQASDSTGAHKPVVSVGRDGITLGILIARFGGATAGERRDGYWLDHRKHIQREAVRPVVVSFDLGRLEEFRQAVREVGQRLGQETMFVRFQDSQVELIPVPKR